LASIDFVISSCRRSNDTLMRPEPGGLEGLCWRAPFPLPFRPKTLRSMYGRGHTRHPTPQMMLYCVVPQETTEGETPTTHTPHSSVAHLGAYSLLLEYATRVSRRVALSLLFCQICSLYFSTMALLIRFIT